MKLTNKEEFAYAMVPLKILAWPVGTWPLEKHNVSSVLRFFVSVCLLILMIIIVLTEIYLDHGDAEKNLDAVVLNTCGILALWKVALFRIRSNGLFTNFSSAVDDYNELREEEKRGIVKRHAYMGRVACASVIGFSYFGSTLFVTVTMFAEDEEVAVVNVTEEDIMDYPIPSKCVINALRLPESLNPVIFIVEYAMMLITSTGNLGSDGLFFGITFHLCGQVEALKLDFTKFVNETENIAERFNALTTRHRHLLKLYKMLNDTVSSILVLQLFTSCVLICTTGFQFIMSLTVHNVIMVIKTLVVVSTLLTQLFAYSYVGEYVTNQMEGIGYSVYCSDWYNIPSHLSGDIVFVVMRAQDPIYLRAGKFFVVNMETYMSIVKTSMSYLSVLRVMVTT
ncbi:odorant receptor 45b-like [Hylaeus anthracinus]|uniref:odorant receptor 45b-like n=1 Tax=Hylaeus anthracinus TaxID=313031 RepID=UPI0023B9DC44|nr:odorant receptor 45b-like [Hylaeus anthracinus]